MSEKKPEKEGEKDLPAKPREREEAAEPAPKKPYVFKILPADPKNSLDFEDVADK
jgi:hypothetical protein